MSEINTKLTGQTLTIHASSDTEIDESGQGSHAARKEHRVETYSRTIMFDQPVQSDGMTQETEGGILKIHVPKVHA
jgi:HSP20 family molecular chaperone IbpA